MLRLRAFSVGMLISVTLVSQPSAYDDKDLKTLKATGKCAKCSLDFADLQGANLRDADLRGANLLGADLSGAHLQGAKCSATKTRWPYGFRPEAAGAVLV